MSNVKLPAPTRVRVEEIQPYENNPRNIGAKSMEAVRLSIENYGYVQPIVVDKDLVIIAGHTRHQALRELGVEEVEVYVMDMPEQQANAYRLVDNRSGELSLWDNSSLTMELRELEDSVLQVYFPDIDLELGQLKTAMRQITQEDMAEATEEVTKLPVREDTLTTDVQCPECLKLFEVKTLTLGVTPEDLALLMARIEG